MRPFFTYFGGKWRAAPKYPAPRYGTIIEPFAGAAGYSVRYADHNVILVEMNPVIVALWKYLIKVSAAEIRRLPLKVENVESLKVCQEAKWLIGFWLNSGNVRPVKAPSTWMLGNTKPGSYWGEAIRDRIALQVEQIRHWAIFEGNYDIAPDLTATWFIDPPYHNRSGAIYPYGSKMIDYDTLGDWCQARSGQTMVCEAEGAVWLPFKPFQVIRALSGANGKSYSREAIWSRDDSPEDAWALV